MGSFGIFDKTKRKMIPLCIYPEYNESGEDIDENGSDVTLANPDDFPEEFFEKTIIMTIRLHEMGVYEEKEIVRFVIPKMLEALEAGEVLSGVSISCFDMAGIVFGENYAGWIYKGETKKRKEFLYRVPYQLLFYHSKKEDNYFICRKSDKLELKQNKVSVSNSHDKEYIIKNTKNIDLTEAEMGELKLAYYILFAYTKLQILLKMNKLGYAAFAEKMAEYFCDLTGKDKFISCAKQYFSLSVSKEDENNLVYENQPFKDFLVKLLRISKHSILLNSSYSDIIEWVEEKTDIKIDGQREYIDHFELVSHVADLLAAEEYYLYFLIREDAFHKTDLLIGKDKNISENNSNFTYDIIAFNEDLTDRYLEDMFVERKVREKLKRFYRVVGVEDMHTMMMNSIGNRVLDYSLFKNYYLSSVYSDDDMSIYDILQELLSRYDMPDLIKNASDSYMTLDEMYFSEFEVVNPIDRVILYADLIRQKKKLLYSFEAGDCFYIGIIEDDDETKERFIQCANDLAEMKEIENYVIYDSEDEDMFVNLLSGTNFTIAGECIRTQAELKERFYKENAENITEEEADKYLSRIAIKKSEIKICGADSYEDGEELEFSIRAENGEYFTNLDLLFQIQRYLTEKIDFEKVFDDNIWIAALRLSVNREKYYLF